LFFEDLVFLRWADATCGKEGFQEQARGRVGACCGQMFVTRAFLFVACFLWCGVRGRRRRGRRGVGREGSGGGDGGGGGRCGGRACPILGITRASHIDNFASRAAGAGARIRNLHEVCCRNQVSILDSVHNIDVVPPSPTPLLPSRKNCGDLLTRSCVP
jgi:hypothetical protein